MVKLISISSLYYGLLITVLCIIINSVNGHPLFLKTIARASSGSSGLNSLNSLNNGQSNSHNGISSLNNNPIQGLINTKINIVGRALIQIGEAFERYGNTDNSGPKSRINNNNGNNNNNKNGASIRDRIALTTKVPGATFDIDAELDARINEDGNNVIKKIVTIKPNGSKTNGKKITSTTEASIDNDDDIMTRDDVFKDITGDDGDKTSTDDGDEKDIKVDDADKTSDGDEMDIKDDGDEKEKTDDGDEKENKDDGDEKENKDDGDKMNTKVEGDEDKDEALKIDIFTLNGNSAGNNLNLESEMKKDQSEGSDQSEASDDVKDDMDINNEGSESNKDENLENLDTINDSNTNNNVNNNGDKPATGNLSAGTQGQGYTYNGKTEPPREYKYNVPNAQSPGYQYKQQGTISPGYTYHSPTNVQPGYNYQGPNINQPGYNYQQGTNIQQNGYKYQPPIIPTINNNNGYNYVQAGSPSSGIKINRIRSTTNGYHYPKPQNPITASFNERVPAQPIPFFNNGQSSQATNFNYRPSVNSQSAGLVTASQIVNNLNNGYNYPTASNINTGVTFQSFNPAPNFNFGANTNSNLGITSSVQPSYNSANIVPTINANTNQRGNSLQGNQVSVQYSQNPNFNVNQIKLVAGTSGPTFVGNQRPNVFQSQQNSGFLNNPILGASSSTLTSNIPISNNINLPAQTVNQNIASPGRPFYAGNNAAGQSLVQSPSIAQTFAQQQQSSSPNFGSFNQNQNLGKPLIDNVAIIPSIVLNLNQQNSRTQSLASNNNQRQNFVQNQNNQGQIFAQNQNNQGQSFAQNQNNQRQNLALNQNNQGQNLAQNQNNQGQNLAQNQNNQGQNLAQNQNNQRSSVSSSNTNLPADNQNRKKPNIDHFAILPSLVREKDYKNTNLNNNQVQTQQKSSFNTSPNFNLNSNSAFTGNNNNNNNQRTIQQQSTNVNTASNSLSNTNSASNRPGYFSNIQNSQINQNQNLVNGFGVGQSDSTIRLSGSGYNTGNNGIGISQGQNQGSANQRPNNINTNNNNNDDDVTKSSINTLSALKNLTESEYYENGAKKLQYPKDGDDEIAFRSASSNSQLVGDIRRYRKQINPIQY